MQKSIDGWKARARQLKLEVYALYLAYRDPRTPWYAKVFSALVVGYAFSPIDLIPDFIPLLGYLDDLLLVPLGAYLAVKMIPKLVMEESRIKAIELLAQNKPVNRTAAVIIVMIWFVLLVVVGIVIYRIAVGNWHLPFGI